MSALAQQGGHSSGWFWTNQKGSCLARSERTHKPWEGEGERKKCHYSLPCTCTHTHLSHLHTLTVSACIYRCIYRTLTHSLSQKDMNTHTERHSNPKNEGSSGCCWEAWGIYLSPMTMKYRNTHAFNISSHSPSSCTHTHTHSPSFSSEARISGSHWLSSKCLGASGIQLAFGAGIRYSNLTLTVTVIAPPSAREDQTHKRTGSPVLTARTAVVVVLKGSLYRNALFMIVIIIIVMII